MTETISSWLMNQDRLNVEQYMNFSSIFERKIGRYVDLIADFKDVKLAIFLDFFATCIFLIWGYVKGVVHVPPLPANLEELKQRITTTLQTATQDMLQHVWEGLEYRIDMCRVSGGLQAY